MKFSKNIKIALAAAGALIASSAGAQSFTVQDVTAAVGSSTVEVSWSWAAGSDVTSVAVDIAYDDSVLTPQVSGGVVTGCISSAVTAAVANASCQVVGGTIAMTLSNNANDVPTFNPGGSITFDVASGTTASTEALALSLFDVSPSGTSVTLNDGSVEFVVIAPAISVDPASGSFTAENGSTDTETFTVTNSGNAAGLTVSAATITGANFNVTSNNCPTSGGLAVAATCSIVVEFAPNAVTSFTASLAIASSAGTENIALTGAGTAGPAGDITITPASTFDFGELLTGEEDATQVFTATNTGAAGSTVTIGSAVLNTLTGSPFSITANTCTASLELGKNESCAVTVKFEPTSDGEATRTLTVSGTDVNSTALTGSSAMKGTGISEARPTANPASGASESEVVGPQGSNGFTVVFGNTGNSSYDVACSLASTDNTSVWSITNGGTTTVAAGASHTVTTTCALPDTETYTATLSCAIGSTQTFTYSYECIGLPPLPVPVDNKWALLLLALMMLMAASFGFRFMARQ